MSKITSLTSLKAIKERSNVVPIGVANKSYGGLSDDFDYVAVDFHLLDRKVIILRSLTLHPRYVETWRLFTNSLVIHLRRQIERHRLWSSRYSGWFRKKQDQLTTVTASCSKPRSTSNHLLNQQENNTTQEANFAIPKQSRIEEKLEVLNFLNTDPELFNGSLFADQGKNGKLS